MPSMLAKAITTEYIDNACYRVCPQSLQNHLYITFSQFLHKPPLQNIFSVLAQTTSTEHVLSPCKTTSTEHFLSSCTNHVNEEGFQKMDVFNFYSLCDLALPNIS
ncbi:hypothetical protein PoB_007049100 [Plakobranchus ocellatus]|uniref:Uncharacterized protein n=1 Tax=Plakobranchus ocellatus TaxID=259542 RepID=A0AAV4DIL2_9GAST|nr:hypothetical protein PoB_007049100 [Plakobranchus ocellatus]